MSRIEIVGKAQFILDSSADKKLVTCGCCLRIGPLCKTSAHSIDEVAQAFPILCLGFRVSMLAVACIIASVTTILHGVEKFIDRLLHCHRENLPVRASIDTENV